jgi:PKD repeat protein
MLGAVLAMAVAITVPSAPSASAAQSPPPAGVQVLSAGQVPTVCSQGDYDSGASAYHSNFGVYWSETSQAWLSAPWCYPRWGYMSMTPSTTVQAGSTVTMRMIGDDPALAGWIAVKGGLSWSHPGTRVSGCTTYDATCTVKMGEVGQPPPEWSWGEFHVSGPGRVFILPPSYAPRCQPTDPCLDTSTNAWGWVGVSPNATDPVADFEFAPQGDHAGAFDFTATSQDPHGQAMTHEWTFGDGTSATGANPSHQYDTPGTYDVGLTSTTADDRSGSTSEEVTVTTTRLLVELSSAEEHPEPVVPFEIVAKVTNHSGAPVTDVTLGELEHDLPTFVEIGAPVPATIDELAAGASVEFRIPVTVNKVAAPDFTLAATASSETGGEVTSNTARKEVVVAGRMTLDWEMEPTFDGTLGTLVTTPEDANPGSWKYEIRITEGCDDVWADVQFAVAGEPLPATRRPGTCSFDIDKQGAKLEPFTLDAAQVDEDGTIVAIGSVEVEPRNFFVISIGDSLSSGEGNPAAESPIWSNLQCHRSMAAGSAKAAKKLEDEDPKTTVSFAHLACSGGSTDKGLTGPFAGVQPAGGVIQDPQIPKIAQLAEGREIDAVVFSIGANDLEFGPVLKKCIKSVFDCFNGLETIPDPLDPDGEATVPEFVLRRREAMSGNYAKVASWLQAAGVQPDRTYSLSYPDSTHLDAPGQEFCGSGPALMSTAEWEWMFNSVATPLDDNFRTASAIHGWKYVDGAGEAFRAHGYCSADTWITSLTDSFGEEIWSPAGAFHPNDRGYDWYRDAIFARMYDDLYPGGEPRPAEGVPTGVPTTTTEAAPKGSDKVEIRNDSFEIGQKVTINPGGPNAETLTIVEKGSLVFDRPLTYDHAEGELIVLAGELPGELDHSVVVGGEPPTTTVPATDPPPADPPPAGPPVDTAAPVVAVIEQRRLRPDRDGRVHMFLGPADENALMIAQLRIGDTSLGFFGGLVEAGGARVATFQVPRSLRRKPQAATLWIYTVDARGNSALTQTQHMVK